MLENVGLVAGETKWFAIEITSDMLGSIDSSDVQVDFTVSGSATLTIGVESVAGNEITNDSVINCSGYFESLTAGKYITANENITGSLSIVFA